MVRGFSRMTADRVNANTHDLKEEVYPRKSASANPPRPPRL